MAGIVAAGEGAPDLDMVELPDQQRVGEELVDRHDMLAVVAFGLGPGADFVDRGLGDAEAAIEAGRIERAAIADEVRRDGFPMQMRDVIALEEGVDRELPVDARIDAIRRKERIGLGLERREIGGDRAEPGIDVDHHALAGRHRLGPHEQQAVFLDRRQAHQPVACEIESGEAHLVGGAQKLAGGVVGPAVIGAGEGPRVAAALRHRRAAMAADIGEGAHLAVGAARHQHRHAGDILGDVVARLGEPRREAHEDRPIAEQPLAFQRRAFAAGIVDRAVAKQRVGEVGGAAVDMAEQPPPDGQFFLSFHERTLGRLGFGS